MATAKWFSFAVLVATLVITSGWLVNENSNTHQAVNDLQAENYGLQSAIHSLTLKNEEMRANFNCLTETVAVMENASDEQILAIYNSADWLAHLEVEVKIKNPQIFDQLFNQQFYDWSPRMVFVRQDPQNPNLATAVLSGSLFQDAAGQYYVLTAGHIRSTTYDIARISATFKNGQAAEFELLGYDSNLDAALLRPKDANFRFAGRLPQFGASANLQVQQTVVHMGSALAIPSVCSTGRINSFQVGSAYPGDYNGAFRQAHLIMHDAQIDAGSSGGPLLNLDGEIVGINVMVGRRFNVWSLTVPIDDIQVIMADLKNGVQR